MTHVVVDPITRIEGHLRIEAEVEGGAEPLDGVGAVGLREDRPGAVLALPGADGDVPPAPAGRAQAPLFGSTG